MKTYPMKLELVVGQPLTREQLDRARMLASQAANYNINADEILEGGPLNGEFYFTTPAAKPPPMTRLQRMEEEFERQKRWIREHGGDYDGYVERYGTAEAPKAGTSGGPAIYEADRSYLLQLARTVNALKRKATK